MNYLWYYVRNADVPANLENLIELASGRKIKLAKSASDYSSREHPSTLSDMTPKLHHYQDDTRYKKCTENCLRGNLTHAPKVVWYSGNVDFPPGAGEVDHVRSHRTGKVVSSSTRHSSRVVLQAVSSDGCWRRTKI